MLFYVDNHQSFLEISNELKTKNNDSNDLSIPNNYILYNIIS